MKRMAMILGCCISCAAWAQADTPEAAVDTFSQALARGDGKAARRARRQADRRLRR
jgi:hypothetical protein